MGILLPTVSEPNQGSLAELYAALSAAQGELSDASKSSENPHFRSRYADLAEVLQTVRPVLSKHGLAIAQLPGEFTGGCVSVTTKLGHKSGAELSSTITVPVSKGDAQGVGAAITYARRYAAAAICGIAQDDDDGETAVGRGKAAGKARPAPSSPAQSVARVAMSYSDLIVAAGVAKSEADLKALAGAFAALPPEDQAEAVTAIKTARNRLGL